jgi:DnaJ domain
LQIRRYDFRIATHLEQFDSNKDYYSVLGARRQASRREIESLYRRLARQRHPDRGGNEDEMKALNEAYCVLHDDATRRQYDLQRQRPSAEATAIFVAPAVREVGTHGQLLSALLCLVLGLMLLLLVRFNGLWFLWPLSILALGVILFGVLMAHSAMTNAREGLRPSHPARRFRVAQEIIFWLVVSGSSYGLYLILTTI